MKYLTLILIITSFSSCSSLKSRGPTSENIHSGEKILYIGDSISAGPLGSLIYEHLSARVGEKGSVNLYGVVSSSPRHWAPAKKSKGAKWLCKQKGRKNSKYPTSVTKDICPRRRSVSPIRHLAKKNEPTLVIFQFLGNSMGMSESSIKRNVTSLIDQVPGAKCIFITSPPYHQSINSQNTKRLQTANRFLKAVDNRCEVFNGMAKERLEKFRENRDYYAGDKKHLSKKGAAVFFNELKELL
jgi:lysophospholipase L1-like esterase